MTSHHMSHWSRRSRSWIACTAAFTILLAAVVATSTARAAIPQFFGEHGEGAGELAEARGIAVSQAVGVDGENGNVFLADMFNSRVDEFSGDGVFVRSWGWGVVDGQEKFEMCTSASGCRAGIGGAGVGQFVRPEGVAVDDSTGFSHEDVYVIDPSNARVEEFGPEGAFILMFGGEVNATKDAAPLATQAERDVCTREEVEAGAHCKAGVAGSANGQFEPLPSGENGNLISVDREGHVYVGDSSRVQRFSEAGAYEATVVSGVGAIMGLTAASGGDLYVQSSARPGVREYDRNGKEMLPVRDATGTPRGAFAVNAAGDLFIDDFVATEQESAHRILEYDASGTEVSSFDKAPPEQDGTNGLALGETANTLYMLNHSTENSGRIAVDRVRTAIPPPPGPLVVPPVSVEPQPHHAAIVKAAINPDGAETTYFVKYGAEGLPSETSVVKTLSPSFDESEVSVELTRLGFSTEYRYCIIARNAHGETPCEERRFVAAPATAIDAEWTQDVTGTSATLEAEVNPEETATECSFEYGTAASYAANGSLEHFAPASRIVMTTSPGVAVSAHVQEGIQPAVEYAYRLTCEKESTVDSGPVQDFRTQAGRASGGLPDGRTLEAVATDVNGAGILPAVAGLPQGSHAGDALAYLRRAPSTAGTSGSRAPEATVDLARHEEGRGWSSTDLTTPYGAAASLRAGEGTEYLLFSEDLSAAVVAPRDSTPLAASASEATPYRRTEVGREALYEPLLTTADVAEGAKFGEQGAVEVQGASSDLSHVVLSSLVPLTSESVPAALYEWSGAALKTVSKLPSREGGAVVASGLGGPHSGTRQGNTRHAVSESGSLVYWQYGAGLYVRDTQTEETLRLDVPMEGVVPQSEEAEGAEFQIASADGSHVFFTDGQRLTPGATAHGEASDLYECDITAPPAGPLSCALSDVTEQTVSRGEHANVQGLVAAADESGGRIFFVAKGTLAEGATAGEFNLYTAVRVGARWQATWVATLSSEDAQDWDGAEGAGRDGLSQLSERSSPDGRYFAFMSSRSLTGYDNRDAISGATDEEVYLYDVAANRLSCVSCDPSGARPHAFFDEGTALFISASRSPIDIEGIWSGHWLAGMLPGWQDVSIGHGLTAYQPRSLSDSGRLFFDSATALSAAAANGTVGVYEFEPIGVGSCAADVAGYSNATGGCTELISPGTAAGDSAFLDASANGDDAFVMSRVGGPATEGGLSPYSILDAHSCEGGSSWPCGATAPSAASGCRSTTAGCEGQSGEQAAPLSSSPSTLTASRTRGVARGGRGRRRGSSQARRCRVRARHIRNRSKRRRAVARCVRTAKRHMTRALESKRSMRLSQMGRAR